VVQLAGPPSQVNYHARGLPRNEGGSIPPTAPTVEQIVVAMPETREDRHGYRLRALIVVLWRGGLRVAEALALGETRPRPAARLTVGAQRQGPPPPRDRGVARRIVAGDRDRLG
jgi:hypothetical protein